MLSNFYQIIQNWGFNIALNHCSMLSLKIKMITSLKNFKAKN